MFEPLLGNIFSSDTTDSSTSPESNNPETPVTAPEEDTFPFATPAVDMQPFMVSVEDEWFYDALAEPADWTAPPVPPPAAEFAPAPVRASAVESKPIPAPTVAPTEPATSAQDHSCGLPVNPQPLQEPGTVVSSLPSGAPDWSTFVMPPPEEMEHFCKSASLNGTRTN